MTTSFTDTPAKTACQAECDKRNKNISKFHPLRWKPLWDSVKGWHPELRPTVEAEIKRPRLVPRKKVRV